MDSLFELLMLVGLLGAIFAMLAITANLIGRFYDD